MSETIAQPGSTDVDEAAALTARITRLSVICAGVLIVLKLVAWRLSGSVAMLASLADSGLDLLAALVTFFAVRYAAVPPDADHRYGHGKAEALASLIQSGLVFVSAIAIGWDAIRHMLHPTSLSHETLAVAIMGVSLVLTGVLVAAQTRALRQAASVAVAADRTHYLADIASNIAALIGIAAAALFHAAWIDPLAGFVVAAWLFVGAAQVFRAAADQLLDRELSAEAQGNILKLAAQDPVVLHVHDLRTRASGPYVHIQMHLALPPSMTLERAHQIVIAAERRLLEVYPAADILIHADPEGKAEPHGGAFARSIEGQETVEETSG